MRKYLIAVLLLLCIVSAGYAQEGYIHSPGGGGGSSSTTLSGDVSGPNTATVVETVGTSTAANVHAAELKANAATSANTPSTIAARDSSGNIYGTTWIGAVTGHASLDLPLTGGTVAGNLNITGLINNVSMNANMVIDVPDVSGNVTLNWGQGLYHTVTFTTVSCNITMTAPASVALPFALKVVQGSGNNCTSQTWGANIKFDSGLKPVFSTTNGAYDVITCRWDGTEYQCALNGKSFS